MPFHPATLSFLPSKGKYYASVTIPKDLQAQFGKTQIKRSTGTADRKEAQRRLHSLEQEIYKLFNPIKDEVEFFAAALQATWDEDFVTDEELNDPQKLRQALAHLLKVAQTESKRPRLPWDQEDGEAGWLKDFATDTAVPALTKMHNDTFANGDRRYWVPEYIDHKKSKEETAAFLATFSVWLDAGGLQELRDWFELVVCEERMFRTAPDTEAKTEITTRDKTADYQVELQDFLEPRKGGFVFSVTQIQADRFRYLAERDIAAVLREMGFIEKRRLSYGRARLWEHTDLVVSKDEKAHIWSKEAENSRLRG